jgi:hypothetical protein
MSEACTEISEHFHDVAIGAKGEVSGIVKHAVKILNIEAIREK